MFTHRYTVIHNHPSYKPSSHDDIDTARNKAVNLVEDGVLHNHVVEVVIHDTNTDDAEFWTVGQDRHASCQMSGHITLFENHLKAEFP
jgi:hypothetical protein